MTEKAIKILIVDDNARYREAFSENLMLQGMEVFQAEHADQAIELLKTQSPDVMVTDLQMRRATEGLDLIRDARIIEPCLPVIMISAVGTFDEGAQASQLGAAHVLSKARIEEEIEILYDCIRRCHATHQKNHEALEKIARVRPDSDEKMDRDQALKVLRGFLDDPALDPYVKSEAFDAITSLSESQMLQRSEIEAERARTLMAETQQENMEKVYRDLEETIGSFQGLAEETREALRTAEYLHRHGNALGTDLELSRTICFYYCFSVENQTKTVLKKRLTKFVAEPETYKILEALQEKKSDHVNIFLQQHLLQIMRDHQMDFTIDNVRQTFLRILAHRSKYRPDGLKALGIIVLVFGRSYTLRQFGKSLPVDNPLGLRGLETDEEVVRFAELLVNLQHFRNPYVHPEIDGQQTISKIRDTALECLSMLTRLK